MNRFPSGPAYDNSSPYLPSFPCSTPECDYSGWTLEELHQCIVCKKRFCGDCLIAIGGEKFCPSCAKCACGGLAIDACMECGTVLCAACLGDFDECKKCRRSGPDPEDLPAEAYEPDDFADNYLTRSL